MPEILIAILFLCAFCAGAIVGGLATFWAASRSFDKSLEEIDLAHHRENLDRNYNFLKLNRRSDRWKDRHWDN